MVILAGVGDCALISKVGQSYDDAIQSFSILLKQRRAAFRFLVRLDRTVRALLGAEHNTVHASALDCAHHFFPSGLR